MSFYFKHIETHDYEDDLVCFYIGLSFSFENIHSCASKVEVVINSKILSRSVVALSHLKFKAKAEKLIGRIL
jgi:uncharacterized protein YcsI (UPF0317 family)